MSRICPECLDSETFERSVAADVLVRREEPDEEEEEEQEEEEEEEEEDDKEPDEEDEGYSELFGVSGRRMTPTPSLPVAPESPQLTQSQSRRPTSGVDELKVCS